MTRFASKLLEPWEALSPEAARLIQEAADAIATLLGPETSDAPKAPEMAERASDLTDAAIDAILASPGHENDPRPVVEHLVRSVLSAAVVEPMTGFVLEPPKSLRLTHIPGHPERNPWVVLTERDAEALRAAIRPGQVWVDMTTAPNSDNEWWSDIRSAVQDQRRQLGLGEFLPGGRPPGPAKQRAAVAAKVTAGMGRRDVWRLGVTEGLWPDTPYEVDDPGGLTHDAKVKRVKSLMALAR